MTVVSAPTIKPRDQVHGNRLIPISLSNDTHISRCLCFTSNTSSSYMWCGISQSGPLAVVQAANPLWPDTTSVWQDSPDMWQSWTGPARAPTHARGVLPA